MLADGRLGNENPLRCHPDVSIRRGTVVRVLFSRRVIVVMTLRTRDLEAIAGASVSFHLNAGADFVIATDHRSSDNTREVLRAFEREGVLRLIEEDGPEVLGREWRTRMARMAVTEYGADWVFSADGDEFWWPRGSSYPEVLEAVPPEYGIVRCPWRPFLAHWGHTGPFYERMTVRFAPQAPLNEPASPYRPNSKIAHRGKADVIVGRGNHGLETGGLTELGGWHPIEILHFPIRDEAQYRQKSEAWLGALETQVEPHRVRAARLAAQGELGSLVGAFGVDDEALARGVAEGSLVVDTRLLDVLQGLELPEPVGARTFAIPTERAAPVPLALPGIVEDTGFAADLAALDEAMTVRAGRVLTGFERRVTVLERPRERRVERPLGSSLMPIAIHLSGFGEPDIVAAQIAITWPPVPTLWSRRLWCRTLSCRFSSRTSGAGTCAETQPTIRVGCCRRSPGCSGGPGEPTSPTARRGPGALRVGRVGARPFSEGPTPVVRGRMPLEGPSARRTSADRLLSLRGWRPFEVFSIGGYHDVEADNVRDTRLADALRTLEGEETGSVEVEQTPEGPRLRFQRAGVVADAAYALEIADLEEIDASFLFTLTKNLDDRITVLERRAWPPTARLVRLKRP